MREARFKALGKLIGALGGADHGAERADHREDARYVALVEDVDGDARAHQIGGDIRLQVGEGQHQIGFERENFRDVRGDESGNPRLLAADLRRPHRIAGDADDAVLLAEQVQHFDGLFGEANDPAGRELAHGDHMPNSGRHVTAAITSEVIA
jgi:hypothetical protein